MASKQYLVYDIETSIYESYGRRANPFDSRNYIVSHGLKYQDGMVVKTHINGDGTTIPTELPSGWLNGVGAIVGINLKFDLLYIWDNPDLVAFFKRGGRIYDVQYAEYLVTAQQHKWPSMNAMAEKYGLELKPDKIKEYWEQGIQTIDIDKQELLDYLDHDLDTTEQLFKIVRSIAKDHNMTNTIRCHMDGLLATCEMEYRGLHIDTDVAEHYRAKLEEDMETLARELDQYIPEMPKQCEFNWGSGDHLSTLLFGGPIKYKERFALTAEDGSTLYAKKLVDVPVKDAFGNEVAYKTGKNAGKVKTKKVKVDDLERPKMRNFDMEFELPGVTKPKKEWELAKEGVYKTDTKVIEYLANTKKVALCKVYAKWKKMDKDLGTYYRRGDKGMLMMVQENDLIHHGLNNVQTETGRLSSSKPNLQNAPRGNTSDVRAMFTSRFGEDGLMGEIDYGQLEVVVQAFLTKDKNMIHDVNNGIDFHCKRLAAKLGESYEDVLYKAKVEQDPWYGLQRTLAKGFSFQRAFGAGKKAIAASTGMPEDEVEKLIEAEDKLYPRVKVYNDWVAATVRKNKQPTNLIGFTGAVRHFGWHPAPTGKRYGFTEYDAPKFLQEKGTLTSFKPTEMKNYSVQGSAGEMVLTVAGKIWRRFLATDNFNGKAYLCNSVHDCFWLDMHKDVAKEVVETVAEIMLSIPEIYEDVYGIDVPVKFKVETEVGKNMRDLGHLEDFV